MYTCIIRDETNYLSFSDFKEHYNLKTNFLTFQGVISAIKSLLKTHDVNNHCCNIKCENLIDTFLKTSKPSRLYIAYKILVDKKQKSPIDSNDCINGKAVYRTPFLCTRISKLLVFQFKLLHRRSATNTFLTKINIKDNEHCALFAKTRRLLFIFSGLVAKPISFGKTLNNG